MLSLSIYNQSFRNVDKYRISDKVFEVEMESPEVHFHWSKFVLLLSVFRLDYSIGATSVVHIFNL